MESGKVEDEQFPSKEYIQAKIEQLEEGELKTESLTEVVSVKEAGEDCTEDNILFDVGSRKVAIKAARAKVRVLAPTTTEQLRVRINLMKIQFEIVRSKHPDRLAFAGYDPSVLGEAYLLLVGSQSGGVRSAWRHHFKVGRFVGVRIRPPQNSYRPGQRWHGELHRGAARGHERWGSAEHPFHVTADCVW